ncbi:hypothetical protein TNCV_4114871 [Trichonephila clavipes]|nr:hypothetical protein TNCV_4114871 [Trichonephila clavipes]
MPPGRRSQNEVHQIHRGKGLEAGRSDVLPARWIVRSVPLEIVGSSGQRKVPTRGNRFWSDQDGHEDGGSKDRDASTCGPHCDSFNDTSRRRRSNCSTNKIPDTLQRQILNPSVLSAHSL